MTTGSRFSPTPWETIRVACCMPAGVRWPFKLWRGLFLLPLCAYKLTLSRLWPGVCRYAPSCSVYAMQAIAGYGVLKGLALGLWRLLRCNPLAAGGYDPVGPEKPRLWQEDRQEG